jgi:hypothetical protein
MKNKVVQFGEQQKFLRLINPNIITENQGILWYNSGIWGNSQDNAMPEFLVDLVNSSSSIHSNLCNLKYMQIQGQNLDINDSTAPNADKLSAFISKRNKSGDNLKAVYSKCSKDFSIFEAACIQILFARDGSVAEIYHVPVENVRMEVPNAYGQVENYFVSRYWADISNVRYKKKTPYNSAIKVHAFSPEQYKEYPVQMMYISSYNPTTFYSIPMYSSAINWILIDNLVSNFHIGNLKTNYFQSGMLVQQGNPTEEEMQKFIVDFADLYQGTGSPEIEKDKMLFSWVDDMKSQKPEFIAFTSDKNEALFKELLDKAEAKIIYAHNAYPEIAGKTDKVASLGGEGNALFVGLQAFTQLVSENMKATLLGGLDRVLEVNQFPALYVNSVNIHTTQPKLLDTDLTEDERRYLCVGLPPKDNQDNTASNTVEVTPNA